MPKKYTQRPCFICNLCFNQQPENNIRRIETLNPFNGKPCVYYLFKTHAHKKLLPTYERWYPKSNNFKKIVPKDIKLTSVVLLHWFLDDGSAFFIQNKKYIAVRFYSMGFTIQDQEFLCQQLKKEFGLKTSLVPSPNNCGTGRYIDLAVTHVKHFYEIIGKPPIESLSYKWKI